MNMNNSLLEVLGVGHPPLSRLVLAARSEGAFGAKITGAGGGGSMVALCPEQLETGSPGAIEACDPPGDRDHDRYGRGTEGEACITRP